MYTLRFATIGLLLCFLGACGTVINQPVDLHAFSRGDMPPVVLNMAPCEALKRPNPFARNPGAAAAWSQELAYNCSRQLARIGYAQEHAQYKLERRAYNLGRAAAGTANSFVRNDGARAAYLHGLAEFTRESQNEQEDWARRCASGAWLCIRSR